MFHAESVGHRRFVDVAHEFIAQDHLFSLSLFVKQFPGLLWLSFEVIGAFSDIGKTFSGAKERGGSNDDK